MQQNSTSELLVKHLYNETTISQSIAIENALASDATLQQEFEQLLATKNALDENDDEAPGASTIQKILTFSKEQELTESH